MEVAKDEELPEGVSEESLYKLIGSRRARLGVLTWKKNEVVTLINAGEDCCLSGED